MHAQIVRRNSRPKNQPIVLRRWDGPFFAVEALTDVDDLVETAAMIDMIDIRSVASIEAVIFCSAIERITAASTEKIVLALVPL